MRVKIPQPGYLDPNPVSLATDVTKFHRSCLIPKKPLKIQLKMKQLQREKKSSNSQNADLGGGQDTGIPVPVLPVTGVTSE